MSERETRDKMLSRRATEASRASAARKAYGEMHSRNCDTANTELSDSNADSSDNGDSSCPRSTPFHTANYAPKDYVNLEEEVRKIRARRSGTNIESSHTDLDVLTDEELGDSLPVPPRFHEAFEVFPFLENIFTPEAFEILVEEMKKATNWHAWPEALYDTKKGEEWKVFPFLHTFPAYDSSKSEWVESNCCQCPKTVSILKSIPEQMGPRTRLTPHTGWAQLSNHVLRCHIALSIPEADTSGVCFNLSGKYRCVLIFDILRPDHIMKGVAKAGRTSQLNSFIDYFRSSSDKRTDNSK